MKAWPVSSLVCIFQTNELRNDHANSSAGRHTGLVTFTKAAVKGHMVIVSEFGKEVIQRKKISLLLY